MNTMKRIAKVREYMEKQNIDAFLVSNFYNILYLTGFKGLSPEEREAWMLVTKNNCYFFTDGRYEEEVAKLLPKEFKLKMLTGEKNLTSYIVEIAEKETSKSANWRIAFESDDLTYAEFDRIAKHMKLFPTNSVIITIRAIKDEIEIADIKKACEITDDCLSAIIPYIKLGVSEYEIARRIEQYLKDKRYELAFYPIVAIDANAALPHYDTKTNGATKVTKRSVILIDFGARFNDYLADMTRMIFVGKPDDALAVAYNDLLKGQEKTIEALRNTTDPKEIDTFCREYLIKKSHPNFPHSTGHGVGLEIHEYPKLSSRSTDTLQKGQIITVEPGIYSTGNFGMRIEDTILLKEDKTPEVLTKFPKEMLII